MRLQQFNIDHLPSHHSKLRWTLHSIPKSWWSKFPHIPTYYVMGISQELSYVMIHDGT